MRKPGNRCAPENVFAGLPVPGIRKILPLRYAGSLRAAEGWPAALRRVGVESRSGRAPVPVSVRAIRRVGIVFVSPAGDQLLPSRIICRTLQSSETRAKLTRLPSIPSRYLPGPSQPPGPPDIDNSISAPWLFQLPFILGQPLPSSENVPPGSKRTMKAPNANG